jgi:hypothetical protein
MHTTYGPPTHNFQGGRKHIYFVNGYKEATNFARDELGKHKNSSYISVNITVQL